MNTLTINAKVYFIGIVTLLFLALSMIFTSTVSAHGYVDSPKSRALLCAEGANYDCGSIIYEPQSLEAPGNFPEAGPADGEIASAGIFRELDEQTEDRWAKVGMSSGAFTFQWTLTAAHATDKWNYFVTKKDWDPNSPLKRSDLELFCTIDDQGQRPPFAVSHDCVIPERSGYHIILAVWEVADTPNAFYNVIDVNFDGEYVEPGPGENPDPDPEEPGDTNTWDANAVYLSGDRVTYNGSIYEALWWTQNDRPGDSSVWLLVNDSEGPEEPEDPDIPEFPEWDANTVYLGGDTVTYNGSVYQALWWTQNETPSDSSAWALIE